VDPDLGWRKKKSGSEIPHHFSESLGTVFRVLNTLSLSCRSGSGIPPIPQQCSMIKIFATKKVFCITSARKIIM
jgi:hypothetical protein